MSYVSHFIYEYAQRSVHGRSVGFLGFCYASKKKGGIFYFMTDQNLRDIQELIGYSFRNTMLLQQAFIRRSYTQEHPDHQNNEVLEFIGDKVLDAAVVRHLASEFGGYARSNNEFVSDYNEGKLTEFKKKLVSKTMLAHRIDILGFNRYLIMGKGDWNNNVHEDASVKEDLFEAILGAVALDCSWNWEKIDLVLEAMLPIAEYLENGFDTNEENYVELIQEWCQKKDHELPQYSYSQYGFYSYGSNRNTKYSCTLRLPGVGGYGYWGASFTGEGSSKPQARMVAAEKAYRYLDEQGMLYTMADMIDEPDINKAINQLQELAHKGYFSMPNYEFEEKHDSDGNPYWVCACSITEYKYYYTEESRSKKDAKKQAAYSMLLYVLNPEEEEEYDDDDDWDD